MARSSNEVSVSLDDDTATISDFREVDPAEVDRMLAEELNGLSLDDRERVMEEVHGIFDRSTIQHDGLEDALRAMGNELDDYYFGSGSTAAKITDDSDNNAFDDTSTSSPIKYSAYLEARAKNSSLVVDRNFRLAFLLSAGNNPKEAALKLMKYLDFIRDLYETSDVLFRPVFLEDLNSSAKQQLVMGSYQILPDRDSSGRRIFCYLRDVSFKLASYREMQQLYIYFHQRIMEDEKGMVAVVFLHNSTMFTEGSSTFEYAMKLYNILPHRYSAIHLCMPNRPSYHLIRSAIMLIVGKESRSRVRCHIGSLVECQYNLRPFGIPVGRLPAALELNTTYRKDNIANHTKWLRTQRAKEIAIRNILSGKQVSVGLCQHPEDVNCDVKCDVDHFVAEGNKAAGMQAVNIFRLKFVECPLHEDCLFGRGRSTMKHPGNVAMRRLIEEKEELYRVALHRTKAEIAWEVVNTIKNGGGRFLKETNLGLYTLVDDETARKKISVAFRDFKSKTVQRRQQSAEQQTRQLQATARGRKTFGTTDTPDVAMRANFTNMNSDSFCSPQDNQCFLKNFHKHL